jgi:hypothetical protein
VSLELNRLATLRAALGLTLDVLVAALRNLPQPPWYQAERFQTLAAVSFSRGSQ